MLSSGRPGRGSCTGRRSRGPRRSVRWNRQEMTPVSCVGATYRVRLACFGRVRNLMLGLGRISHIYMILTGVQASRNPLNILIAAPFFQRLAQEPSGERQRRRAFVLTSRVVINAYNEEKARSPLTTCRLTISNGISIILWTSVRHLRATRWKPAPGNQAGTCFTTNMVFCGKQKNSSGEVVVEGTYGMGACRQGTRRVGLRRQTCEACPRCPSSVT